jgi:Na+/citrate or Na+/malate symporter
LFIACIIVGSILGMDRGVLVQGFLKIFGPLVAASVVGGVVGTVVGVALGLGAYHTFFFVVVPIMAGGVDEGAIPLSIGYAQILHQQQGDLFAQVLPPVMLASLTAILLSGMLNYVGKKYPHLTGEGRLQPGEHDELITEEEDPGGHVDVTTVAAAVVTAVTLYLIGALAQRIFSFPAPVAMLVIAVMLKLGRVVSPSLQLGAFHVYKFFSTAVTYPLLFAIGVSLTPWDKLVAAFTLPYVVTIVSTVVTIIATGFFVGGWMKMYPIDTAIITACHSGQGGTGDVAILTAGNRMQLMPFAQIATRIGGAIRDSGSDYPVADWLALLVGLTSALVIRFTSTVSQWVGRDRPQPIALISTRALPDQVPPSTRRSPSQLMAGSTQPPSTPCARIIAPMPKLTSDVVRCPRRSTTSLSDGAASNGRSRCQEGRAGCGAVEEGGRGSWGWEWRSLAAIDAGLEASDAGVETSGNSDRRSGPEAQRLKKGRMRR